MPPAAIINPFTVTIDTREQRPYLFTGLSTRRGPARVPLVVKTQVATLAVGDYSIFGCPGVIVERKSKEDLFGSVAKRANFEKRLAAMGEFTYAAVVVECSVPDLIERPPAYSRMNPKSLIRTLLAWDQRYRVSWWFAGDRQRGEGMTFRILERFWVDQRAKGRG